MKRKQIIREKFRTAVFERDGHKCVICGSIESLDAHHITDRNIIPNGGYVKENGISLCPECHLLAEHQTNHGFHPDDLYEKINSSKELAWSKSKLL